MIESVELLHKHRSKIDTNYYNDKLHSQIYSYFEYVCDNFDKTQSYFAYLKNELSKRKEDELKYLSPKECQPLIDELDKLGPLMNEQSKVVENIATEMDRIMKNQNKIKSDNRNSKIDSII